MTQLLLAVSTAPTPVRGGASPGPAFWLAVGLVILVPVAVVGAIVVRMVREPGRLVPAPDRRRTRRRPVPPRPAGTRPGRGRAATARRRIPPPLTGIRDAGYPGDGYGGDGHPARSGGPRCAMCGRPATEHTEPFAGRMLCPGARSGTYTTDAELDHLKEHPGYYPEGPSGM